MLFSDKDHDAAAILADISVRSSEATPEGNNNRKAKRRTQDEVTRSSNKLKFRLSDIQRTNVGTLVTTYSTGDMSFTVPVYKGDTDTDFKTRRRESAKRVLFASDTLSASYNGKTVQVKLKEWTRTNPETYTRGPLKLSRVQKSCDRCSNCQEGKACIDPRSCYEIVQLR